MNATLWPANADIDVSRRNSAEVARLLGSKSVRYHRETIGEPKCHYKVGLHTGEFWFTLKLSDRSFVFFGEHRRRDAFVAPGEQIGFVVALKLPWPNMVATKPLPGLSERLGVDVFTQAQRSEARCSAVLLHPSVADLIGRVSFTPVHLFFLNHIQIHFTSDFLGSTECVNQSLVLRDLLLTVHRVASNPNAPKR